MKNASTRIVFDYWDELRGDRAAPERGEIEPGAIREALADAFIIETEDGEPVFRLAGTRIGALFGSEMKGRPFMDMWPDAVAREDMQRLLSTVMGETAGAVAGLIGETEIGDTVHLELLLLPLRHRGRTHARAMGALAPVVAPAWLGARPVVRIKMISLRMIWPTGFLRGLASSAARRAGLRVLEGGRRAD